MFEMAHNMVAGRLFKYVDTDHNVRALAKVKVAQMHNQGLDLHHVLVLWSTELADT